MKLEFKNLLASSLAIAAGLVLFSCGKEQKPDDETPVVDQNGNTYVTTDCITPIRYVEGDFIGGATGVSVTMEEISSNNIKFICEPGTDINSFLVQVYPMGTFYNTLIEAMHSENKTSLSVEETADYLTQAITLTDEEGNTSGGALYSRTEYGDEFDSIEIDLATSSFVPYHILPGVEYLVVVQACFDDNGTRLGDLAVCHVEATPKEAAADVTIGVQVEPSINSVGVTLTPGAACSYVIYHGNYREQIDEYIDAYGDEMYHDLLCHAVTEPLAVSEIETQFRISDIEPESAYTVAAVAFAADYTPAARVTRVDCDLETIPEDAPEGECEFMTPEKVASSIATFDVVLDEACLAVHYNIVTPAEADELMALEGAAREAKIEEIRGGGWAIERPNSAPIGTKYTYPDLQNELASNTEYTFVYITSNEYGQISDLKKSDMSFTTKTLVKDQPEKSIEDARMEIINPTRTALTLKFTYDPEKTAVIMHRNAFPVVGGNGYNFPEEISETYRYDRVPGSGDGQGWLYWFLDFRHADPNQTRWPDFINALAIPNFEPVRVPGYDSDTEYQFAYIAEDVNGVLGEVKTCKGKTLSAEGGTNPQITGIDYKLSENGEYVFTFHSNEDMVSVRYFVKKYNGGTGDAVDLYLSRVLKKNSSDYQGVKNQWIVELTGEMGLNSVNLDASVSVQAPLDPDLTIAVAIAYGQGDTESELATLLIDGEGNEYTLEEWYGLETKYLTVPRY